MSDFAKIASSGIHSFIEGWNSFILNWMKAKSFLSLFLLNQLMKLLVLFR